MGQMIFRIHGTNFTFAFAFVVLKLNNSVASALISVSMVTSPMLSILPSALVCVLVLSPEQTKRDHGRSCGSLPLKVPEGA